MNRTKNLPKRFSRRTLIVVLVGFVMTGVLAAAAVLVHAAIERAAYRAALTQTNTVVKSYNAVVENTSAYTATVANANSSESDVAEQAARYKTTFDKYVGDVDSLSKERGIAVSDITPVYQKFLEAHKKFVTASSDRAVVMSAIATMSRHCREQTLGAMDPSDLSRLVEVYDATFTPCVKGVEQLASSKDEVVQAAGKKAKDYFDSLKAHVVAMQTQYQAGNRTQFETEYKTFLSLAESLTTYTDTTAIRAYYNNLLPGKQLTDLAQALAGKVK